MNVNEKYKGFSIIGDYIEEQTFRVGYDNHVEISGINIGKGFIPTVANMNGIIRTFMNFLNFASSC